MDGLLEIFGLGRENPPPSCLNTRSGFPLFEPLHGPVFAFRFPAIWQLPARCPPVSGPTPVGRKIPPRVREQPRSMRQFCLLYGSPANLWISTNSFPFSPYFKTKKIG